MCNRPECPDPAPHVHLRRQDELAIAEVLMEQHWQRLDAIARRARLEEWWKPVISPAPDAP